MRPDARACRTPAHISFNLAFLDGTPLSGPGYYAVRVFEELHRLIGETRPDLCLTGFVQKRARHHLSPAVQDALRTARVLGRGRAARVAWEQAVLPFAARRAKVDLLFSPAFISPLWGAPRLVACIHDMYYAVIPELIDPRQRRYWQTLMPASVRRCDRVIVVSAQTGRDVVRTFPHAEVKVRVTPLASRLLPDAAADPPAGGTPYVLVVANLTRNKNIEAVLNAIAAVRAAGVPLRLRHVGRDNEDRLAVALRQPEIAAFVEPLGKVSDPTLVGLYRGAFCVVTASLYEGFGIPAVEAQALGAPLLSSDRGALPEAAGPEGALYFDPERPAELAAALQALWADPALRDRLRTQGRANAARYSWRLTAERTLAVFDELLKEPLG